MTSLTQVVFPFMVGKCEACLICPCWAGEIIPRRIATRPRCRSASMRLMRDLKEWWIIGWDLRPKNMFGKTFSFAVYWMKARDLPVFLGTFWLCQWLLPRDNIDYIIYCRKRGYMKLLRWPIEHFWFKRCKVLMEYNTDFERYMFSLPFESIFGINMVIMVMMTKLQHSLTSAETRLSSCVRISNKFRKERREKGLVWCFLSFSNGHLE